MHTRTLLWHRLVHAVGSIRKDTLARHRRRGCTCTTGAGVAVDGGLGNGASSKLLEECRVGRVHPRGASRVGLWWTSQKIGGVCGN